MRKRQKLKIGDFIFFENLKISYMIDRGKEKYVSWTYNGDSIIKECYIT